ncbi:MAG TPA: DUF362 domain-containing protein [Polyangiaceae bacterium]
MSVKSHAVSRRHFLEGSAALLGAAAGTAGFVPEAEAAAPEVGPAAPPSGFTPMSAPGKIVKVSKGTDFAALMQPNLLWPKPEVARQMLEKAMMTFTGAPNLAAALGKFIHKDDIVAVKVNGIAGQNGASMAVNFELIQPVVEGLVAYGVPAENITVYEQYGSYLLGTRVGRKGNKLPEGVKTGVHSNGDAKMKSIAVFEKVKTKYVRFLTEATAVIDMTQIKDHSICGYTGCLKNMTHGSIINPEKHHAHHASPQIAVLYAHEILQSRVRLHITDGFKIIYDQGPLDKNPKRRIPHGAVYVSTDAVAMDTIGWQVIEKARAENGMKTLAKAGREPTYIARAAELGVGIHDTNKIRLQEISI